MDIIEEMLFGFKSAVHIEINSLKVTQERFRNIATNMAQCIPCFQTVVWRRNMVEGFRFEYGAEVDRRKNGILTGTDMIFKTDEYEKAPRFAD